MRKRMNVCNGYGDAGQDASGRARGVGEKCVWMPVAVPEVRNPLCAYCRNEFAGSAMSIGTTASVVLDTPDKMPVAVPKG